MTKEQAEEAAQEYEAEAAHWRDEVAFAQRARLPHSNIVLRAERAARAALALRAHWPMLEALETACATIECASLFPPDHPVEHLQGQELLWHKRATAALALARKEP